MGATDAQLSAVSAGSYDGFEPAWRAALHVADRMTTEAGQLSDAEFGALSACWSPEEIIEVVSVVGLFNYFNRVANALRIPPTK